MKHQTNRKPMDEREKLRKFRELDDAFAEALRELDSPDSQLDIPTGPPVAPLAEAEQDEATRQQRFEERLRALMQEYHQPAEQVARLLQALQKMGRIA
jgi:hypothetical protein